MYTIYSLDYQNPHQPSPDCSRNKEDQPEKNHRPDDKEAPLALTVAKKNAYEAVIDKTHAAEYTQLMENLNQTEQTSLDAMGRLLQPRLLPAARTAAQEAFFNKVLNEWEFHCLPQVVNAEVDFLPGAEEQAKTKDSDVAVALGLNDLCCRKLRQRLLRYHRVPIYKHDPSTENERRCCQ